MNDYTPTTIEVRKAYCDAAAEVGPAAHDATEPAEFDRWLAAHDAEVRAAVLAEQGFLAAHPITDEMVEAVARVTFEPPSIATDEPEYTWAEMVREDPSRAGMWRADARAALEAAEKARP